MPIAAFSLGDALLLGLELALLFFWIWIAIAVVADVFRSPDLSGWGKAAWIFVIVIIPLLGLLLYLIVRGGKMRDHTMTQMRDQDAAFRQYVRTAASSPADDIAKLEDLRNRGVLSEEEFQRAKDKTLAA
jgi:hypothetical protein